MSLVNYFLSTYYKNFTNNKHLCANTDLSLHGQTIMTYEYDD